MFFFVLIGVAALLLILSVLWHRFHPRKPRGVHFGVAAEAWASSRFAAELRPMAAFVADVLCAQLGVGFEQLEPQTRFIEDLQMDDLEPVEVVMALEEDLGIKIPDEDCGRLLDISELVRYLHRRLHEDGQIV